MMIGPQRLAISNITAINGLGPAPTFVIGRSPTRTGITFHNPGQGAVVVFPEHVIVNNTNQKLVPSLTALGGGFYLAFGATLFLGAPTCQQAWQAMALAGTVNPLTIMEQT